MTDDLKLLRWFLGSEPVGMALNWPISPETLLESTRSIHILSKKEGADPTEICEAWRRFSGAVGPTLISQIIGSNEWREIVPQVEGYGDDWCNLWAGNGKAVVARVVYDGERPINVAFSVENS